MLSLLASGMFARIPLTKRRSPQEETGRARGKERAGKDPWQEGASPEVVLQAWLALNAYLISSIPRMETHAPK